MNSHANNVPQITLEQLEQMELNTEAMRRLAERCQRVAENGRRNTERLINLVAKMQRIEPVKPTPPPNRRIIKKSYVIDYAGLYEDKSRN